MCVCILYRCVGVAIDLCVCVVRMYVWNVKYTPNLGIQCSCTRRRRENKIEELQLGL